MGAVQIQGGGRGGLDEVERQMDGHARTHGNRERCDAGPGPPSDEQAMRGDAATQAGPGDAPSDSCHACAVSKGTWETGVSSLLTGAVMNRLAAQDPKLERRTRLTQDLGGILLKQLLVDSRRKVPTWIMPGSGLGNTVTAKRKSTLNQELCGD